MKKCSFFDKIVCKTKLAGEIPARSRRKAGLVSQFRKRVSMTSVVVVGTQWGDEGKGKRFLLSVMVWLSIQNHW